MAEQYTYGLHAVMALLTHRIDTIKKLYVNQERIDKRMDTVVSLAASHGILIEKLPLEVMNQRFSKAQHQGVVAYIKPLPIYSERDLPQLLTDRDKPYLLLILDGITDPHNLGACLRTAEAAGVDFVIIPKDKSADITPVVSKIACGAAEVIPLVRVTNLVRTIEVLKKEGIWIYGAAGESTQLLYALDCKQSIALVMGAEGEGLRRLTREHCDDLFAIPMRGSVMSLNVSVAAGICLYEVVRQRYN